jgi:hypothetical protein
MPLQYNDLLIFVQLVLPAMRVTRQRNLAWLVLGLLQVRDAHLTVSEIARAILTRSNHWHKFKRMHRFLSNVKWSPQGCFPILLQFLLSRFRTGAYLPVIIDQSTIAGRWEVLWASIPFRGRALPFCFRLFTTAELKADPEGSQPKLEDEFIATVVHLLPCPAQAVLLLDRGYARVSLLRLLGSLGVKYVLRVRADTWVYYRPGYEGPLAKIKVRRGELLWWRNVDYQKRERYPTNLAITLNAIAAEPWYLVTNLSRAAATIFWYERRFRCEELFKDIKDQLHLETLRIKQPCQIERLLFGLVIAYYALTLIGVAAQRAGLRRKVCKDRVSAAWMALRLLKMPQFLKPAFVRRALFTNCWSLSYESE